MEVFLVLAICLFYFYFCVSGRCLFFSFYWPFILIWVEQIICRL